MARDFKVFQPARTETISVAQLMARLREASSSQGVTHVYLGSEMYFISAALERLGGLGAERLVNLAPTFTVNLPVPEEG